MIVWGGPGGNIGLNTGGRYIPATDTWTLTSIANASDRPICAHGDLDRQRNDRVGWTGGSDYFNTGGKDNPSTDTWTATNTSNAPTARGYHMAV